MKKLYLIDGVNFVILDGDQYDKAKHFKWRLGSSRGGVLRNVIEGEVVSSQTLNSFLFKGPTKPLNSKANDYRKENRASGFLHHSKLINTFVDTKVKRKKNIPVGIQHCHGGYVVKLQRNNEIRQRKYCGSLKEAKAELRSIVLN